jgi:hypothetical protein
MSYIISSRRSRKKMKSVYTRHTCYYTVLSTKITIDQLHIFLKELFFFIKNYWKQNNEKNVVIGILFIKRVKCNDFWTCLSLYYL